MTCRTASGGEPVFGRLAGSENPGGGRSAAGAKGNRNHLTLFTQDQRRDFTTQLTKLAVSEVDASVGRHPALCSRAPPCERHVPPIHVLRARFYRNRTGRGLIFLCIFLILSCALAARGDVKMMPVPIGHVRAGPLQPIPQVLRERGVDPTAVFAQARVDPDLLSDSENTIHYTDVYRLMAMSAHATKCGHFGLLVGSRCKVEQLGLIGLLAAQAPNLGAALRDLIDHIFLFDTVTKLDLRQQKEQTRLCLTLPEGETEGTNQSLELVVTIAFRVVRELAGPAWGPNRVLLAHRPRGPTRPYVDFFQAPVAGGAGETGLEFPVTWLKQSLAGSAVLRRYLESYVSIVKDSADASLAGSVTRKIRAAPSLKSLTEESVARSMGMEPNAFRRRLTREKASYREILDSAYRDRALHLMGTPDLNLTQIAAMLGFAELSVFTRAFRRWTGMTPTQWRRTGVLPNYAASNPMARRSL